MVGQLVYASLLLRFLVVVVVFFNKVLQYMM